MNLTGHPTPAQRRLIRIHLALIPVYAWILFAWTAYAIDISPAGRLDRSGHIKGHDFAHFYVLGEIANDHASADLYSFEAQAQRMDRLVPEYENRFAPIHGPQLSLLFAPLARLPYEVALAVWLSITGIGYAVCCIWLYRRLPGLRPYGWVMAVLAVGYPPFYFLIAFGQDSVLALACVTAAYLALRARRPWLAGLALGSLFYKPSFGVALPFALLYGREWRVLLGGGAAMLLQLALAWAYYGADSLRQYLETITHVGEIASVLEPLPYQMQSLRSFFSVLLPWPDVAFALYLLTAATVIILATRFWRTSAALEVRYSVLLLATVLANPHVNPYDLIVIVPVFILIAGWAISQRQTGWWLWALLYLSFYLPALWYLPAITDVQVSVIALVGLTVALISHGRTGDGAGELVRA